MKVRALSTITLGPGTVLTLTPRQAERRAAVLLPEGNGRYRTTALVQFKAGEEFGADADLPKALAAVVETDAPAAPRKAAFRRPAPGAQKPAAAVPPVPAFVDPAQLDIG